MADDVAVNAGSWGVPNDVYEEKLLRIGLKVDGSEVLDPDPVFVPTNFVNNGPDMFEWWKREMQRAQMEWNARLGMQDEDDYEEEEPEEFYTSSELLDMYHEAARREFAQQTPTVASEQAPAAGQPPKPEGAAGGGGVDAPLASATSSPPLAVGK